MFIQVKHSGYTTDGQQHCSGLFLILTQPKESEKYPHMSGICSDCGKDRAAHSEPLPADVQAVSDRLHRVFMSMFWNRTQDNVEDRKDAAEIVLDTKREVEGCRYFRPSLVHYPIRAIVRHVAMRQLGHFMMGNARVKGHKLTLSGAYGSDGLPDTVPEQVYECGLELPQSLYDAWNNGNGWNSAGSEAGMMRQWAMEHLKELRK